MDCAAFRSKKKPSWPTTERLFDALCQYPHAFTTAELIARVWPNPNCEPSWAAATIHKTVWDMNRRFLPRHWPLLRIAFRDNRYRLRLIKGKSHD